MKKLMIMMASVAMMFMVGCASVTKIGDIGKYEIYKAKTVDAFAPSTTTIIASDNATIQVLNKGVGSGVIGTVAMPVATIGSAAIVARGMEAAAKATKPDNTNIDVKNGNNIKNEGSVAVAGAVAGASSSSKSGVVNNNTVKNTNLNVNMNKNVNEQMQGQAQGQAQGQMQNQELKGNNKLW